VSDAQTKLWLAQNWHLIPEYDLDFGALNYPWAEVHMPRSIYRKRFTCLELCFAVNMTQRLGYRGTDTVTERRTRANLYLLPQYPFHSGGCIKRNRQLLELLEILSYTSSIFSVNMFTVNTSTEHLAAKSFHVQKIKWLMHKHVDKQLKWTTMLI